MVTDEQWAGMTPEEKKEVLSELEPSVRTGEMLLYVEDRGGKVARFTIRRYNPRTDPRGRGTA